MDRSAAVSVLRMRVLFTNWAWPTRVHHLASLGEAFGAAGHDVGSPANRR
jgi:hypothetical protein